MALRSRVKISGWSFGEILTSAQMTQVDINAAESVQGTSGTYGIEQLTGIDIHTSHSPYAQGTATDWVCRARNATTTVATGSFAHWMMDAPHGATITGWTIRVIGPTGHAAFPGGAPTMPTCRLFYTLNTGLSTGIGASVTDTSATAGAYEAVHSISQTGLSHVVDTSLQRYHLEFGSESGANGLAGTLIVDAYLTVTINAMNPRAC